MNNFLEPRNNCTLNITVQGWRRRACSQETTIGNIAHNICNALENCTTANSISNQNFCADSIPQLDINEDIVRVQ